MAIPIPNSFLPPLPINTIINQVIPIRNQIHLPQSHNLRILIQLPTQQHSKQDRNLDIERQEIHSLEHGAEARPALH